MNLCICQFHMLIFMTVSTYEDSFFPKEAVQSPEGVWQKAVRFSSWFFGFFFVGLLGIHPVFVYVHTVYWLVYMGKKWQWSHNKHRRNKKSVRQINPQQTWTTLKTLAKAEKNRPRLLELGFLSSKKHRRLFPTRFSMLETIFGNTLD